MRTTPAGTDLLFGCAVVLLTLAAVLLKMCWLPRRRGTEPRCKACGYDVTGNESGRCPECGADLHPPEAVVHGIRRRRPWVGVAGVLVLLPGIACLTPQARRAAARVDWYKHQPDTWVIGDLRSTASAEQLRAFAELQRRLAAGKLSEGRVRQRDDALLAAHAASPAAFPPTLLNHLTARFAEGALTEGQRHRFFRQMFRLELRARPRVTAGARLAWEVTSQTHGRPGELRAWRHNQLVSVKIDGGDELERRPGPANWRPSVYDLDRLGGGWVDAPQSPGTHALRVVYRVKVAPPADAEPDWQKGPFLFDGDFPVETTFVVLPPGADEGLSEVGDPALGDALREALRPAPFRVMGPPSKQLTGGIQFRGPLPAGVAFDVFVRAAGREHRVLSFARRKGHGPGSGFVGPNPLAPGVERVDVVLRSNPAVARDTLDVHEYWAGELVYTDVPIERPPPASR